MLVQVGHRREFNYVARRSSLRGRALKRNSCRESVGCDIELEPPPHSAFDPKSLFLFQSQIAQFDCSVCTGEEADEARTDRDDPRRIDTGYNPDVDEPSLQHSTADCASKPKNDPKNKDERRLQGFFHCLPSSLPW